MENKSWDGQLILTIVSAKNLNNKDWVGLSDPYCLFQVSSIQGELFNGRTRTVIDNLNPVWKTTFSKQITGSGPITLKFNVMDEDDVGSDDFLGMYTYQFIPAEQFQLPLTFKLVSKSGKPHPGELDILLTWIEQSKIEKRKRNKETNYVFPGGQQAEVLLGPVLLYHGSTQNLYHIDILAVFKGNGGDTPLLTINTPPVDGVKASLVLIQGSRSLWRYRFAIARFPARHRVCYTFNGGTYKFEVPGLEEPIRCLFMSCNGFHDPEERKKLTSPEFEMWDHIVRKHKKLSANGIGGYHLILQGGDQVYADEVFHLPFLEGKTSGDESVEFMIPPENFVEEVEKFYMDLYIRSWSGPHIKDGLASIPSVMMWDDHDIFDGWGSYSDNLSNSPVYQILWKTAEKYYCAFQLGSTLEEILEKKLPSSLKGDHFGKSQMFKVNRLGIACLDLRTERSLHRVCSEGTYIAFHQWLQDNGDIDHLYLVLSIPIVYNDFSLLEKAIEETGLGKELEDDLKDHWRTEIHQKERVRFLKSLVDAAEKLQVRITILSGDVHVGCAGVLFDQKKVSNGNASIINCLVSSAVVNVPPPPSVINLLELTGGKVEIVENSDQYQLIASLYRFMSRSDQRRYIPNRNYLELLGDNHKGVRCSWYCDGDLDNPYELYINRCRQGPGLYDLALLSAEEVNFVVKFLGGFIGLTLRPILDSWLSNQENYY